MVVFLRFYKLRTLITGNRTEPLKSGRKMVIAQLNSIGYKQGCGSGFVIRCLFDPWILDPGWVKVRIRTRDEQPGSYFLELRNHFLGFKYFNSLMRIWDPGWKKVGSGIRYKHPGSLTMGGRENKM
jgi:hypothetical protein